MNAPRIAAAALLVLLMSQTSSSSEQPSAPAPRRETWRGVHLLGPARKDLPLLKRAISDGLKPLGINAIVLEVNYRFQYQSHPELGERSGLTQADARDLARFCRSQGIRLIPQFNCLGHQSWAGTTFPLLSKYPEFDETPEIPPDNAGIYCRSWCPSNPDVNRVVFALLDELVESFEAREFHVGMDEVFLIGSEQCQRCRGKDPAELFARAVNDLHQHLVQEKGLTMLMWGDRLLDAASTGYGKWEASENGTAPAVDLIPRDIIVCDWHYEVRESYPSIPFFVGKGFRVWPASWNKPEAGLTLLREAFGRSRHGVIGYLGTTWVYPEQFCRALLDDRARVLPNARGAVDTLRACMRELDRREAQERGWISLFNGKDLTGWTPKFRGHDLGENYLETFRVADGVLQVSYDKYERFDRDFGHLFYREPFSSYRLRLEYRFVGDQVPGGPSWGVRNSGAMLHCQPPETMRKEQEFPVSIEVQLLGGVGESERPTANLCTPGTHVVMDGKLITQHCTQSRSQTYRGDQWVTVEVEVHGDGEFKHFVNGELVMEYERPQLDDRDEDARALLAKRGGEALLSSGYISLQAESHPLEFRKIELLPLEE